MLNELRGSVCQSIITRDWYVDAVGDDQSVVTVEYLITYYGLSRSRIC